MPHSFSFADHALPLRRQAGKLPLLLTAAASLAAFSPASWATNGYFAHGYGTQSEGIAGIGIALPQDALAAASNPAGIVRVGDRIDAGATLFRPRRESEIHGNAFGADGSYSGNGTDYFLIPNVGYVHQLGNDQAVSVAVYGNGGMNTDYNDNPYRAFGSSGKAGVNLEQLFITPAYAWQYSTGQSIGIGLNLAYQRFSAKGLGAFSSASGSPDHLSNRGTDNAYGYGLRLGWTGDLGKDVTAGLAWSSRVRTDGFDRYKGLFAEHGDFDIPENYGAGLAWRLDPAWTLAGEYQFIRYSEIDAVGNNLANLFSGNPLGSSHGPGFGWEDIHVWKIGANYAVNDTLTLRAGYSHASQPVQASETFFNILAPGVVQNHYTLGATWKIGNNEISASYAHAPRNTVNGSHSIPASFGGGEADVHLAEDLVGVSYAWKF